MPYLLEKEIERKEDWLEAEEVNLYSITSTITRASFNNKGK